MPPRLPPPRRVRRFLFLPLLVAASLHGATPAQGQAPQNPSPMSDTTRPHPRASESRPDGRRATLSLGELFVPARAVQRGRAAIPLVVHFHGASWLAEQHVARSAPHAALVTVNLGAGSGRYAAPFADPTRFAALVAEAADAATTLLGRSVRWTGITLTSFSAGYGAVRAIVAHPSDGVQVTGVVLLDSLHASYEGDGPPPGPRAADLPVKAVDLAPFARLAADAVAGRMRFWITHSEVYPGTYASTTEATDALLASVGLTRRAVLKRGPLGMQQLSEARRGGLHVLGFAGNSAPDHVDHLHALGEWLRAWKVVR